MNISEKSAHLKGLMEGMDYDLTTKEGKLFAAIADLLEDISLTVLDLEDETAVLGDYIEELDEDLGEVERTVYDIDDDDEYDDECCCDDDECDCGCCDDDECIELTCPACGEQIYIEDEEIDDMDTIECPSCNKVLNVVKGEEDDSEEESEE
ncbi:MAG: hypothetical protein A2Y15_01395 [Clostridiales bacterium GWF2_36_10]|nr:MAG: hypothetical protein A2Y15_01395 [Clostridiales bacterium GWF2_36_10]HAN22056.1 hypothetical protein [Clostridiales bacterium]